MDSTARQLIAASSEGDEPIKPSPETKRSRKPGPRPKGRLAQMAAAVRLLEARNEELEQMTRRKSEYLANVSHELRAPLNTVIGFAELLAEETEGPLTGKQRRFVGNIQRDAQYLLTLINGLLDLSKIEAGQMDLRLEAFQARSAIEEVVASIRPPASEKLITVEIECDESVTVLTDPFRFKQVLFNLLSNALKFTPEGGNVWIGAANRGDFVEVSVRDTGIGIPKERQASIFDRLYQAHEATREVGAGAGLGLAISKRLVEHQGGSIWVESERGKGTRFTFTVHREKFQERAAGS